MHKKNYRFDYQEEPSHRDESVLFKGITAEAVKARGLEEIRSFGIFVRDDERRVLGGATGVTYYGCLYVDMLWVDKSLRHCGYGTMLMQKAEQIGKERGCTFATVNTMDWEALPFYQKLGYTIEFTREGYAKNSKMYLLRKQL